MQLRECFSDMTVKLSMADNENIQVDFKPYCVDSVHFFTLIMSSKDKIEYPEIMIDIEFPFVEIHHLWTPSLHGNPKTLRNKGIPEWWCNYTSHISHSTPIGCFYNEMNKNRLTYAFSDAKNIINIHAGAYEEDCIGRIRLKLFTNDKKKRSTYKSTLRIDRRTVSFSRSLESVTNWLSSFHKDDHMPIPNDTIEPVYSSWYAFHQNLDQFNIEEQCKLAHELGCKTLILDDGWQTDDNNRGYKYCGDWVVSLNRFPTFKEHIKNIQKIGMKYILWLSVPFIGKESNIWNEFSSYILFFNSQFNAGVLDPRYPNVREHIINKFTYLVSEYNLDGLKLDFIDEFDFRYATDKALLLDSNRDTESLPDAVDLLMSGIKESLLNINPNIMIEFRQNYIGSLIRKYGNLFRVHDCPNDSITNRVGIIDLRLLSGDTPVHSDMLTWSPDDSLESIGFQFINILFSVPQISPNLLDLPDKQKKLIKHWLDFYYQHRDILLKGEIEVIHPELNYPIVRSKYNSSELIAIYSNLILELNSKDIDNIIIVNGTCKDLMYIKSDTRFYCQVKIYDCLGELISTFTMLISNLITEMSVPRSGYITLSIE